MVYRIEYAGGKRCHYANGRTDLLKRLKTMKNEEITDIRRIYKSGVSDSVMEKYLNIIEKIKADAKGGRMK